MNRLFVLSFENKDDRTSFSKYCTPTIEIKDFNVLIDLKSFFNLKQQILSVDLNEMQQYSLSLKKEKRLLLSFHIIL